MRATSCSSVSATSWGTGRCTAITPSMKTTPCCCCGKCSPRAITTRILNTGDIPKAESRERTEIMKKMERRTWLAAAGVSSLAAGLAGSVMADDHTEGNPRHFQDIPPRELIQRRHLPNIELITQNGEKVRFYDDLVKDKIVVLNFMYTHCEKVCPSIMRNLTRVQK